MRTDILKLSLLAAALLPFSCLPLQEEAPVPEQTVRLEFLNDDATKSRYTEADMKRIHTLTVYGIDNTGYWKKVCFSPGETPLLRFPAGRNVNIYVLANMGDVTLPTQSRGIPWPEAFTYLLPEQMNIPRTGIPMAAKVQAKLPPSAQDITLQIPLERLLAKVVVHIDKSGLTGGVDAPVALSDKLCICQANRRLMPFAPNGSLARRPADLFSGDLRIFDEETFGVSGDALEHSDLVLYVPENRQGVLLDSNDESLKVPSKMPAGKAGLCTYIEYKADKDGSEDGVGGALCYRAFLGGNVSNDFSVRRNATYNATLSLTWDGLVWRADGWRIDASAVSDQRRLRFLDASGNETSYLKIHRNGDGEFYAYFSVDDDASGGTAGRKDAPSYPYGWNLSFNGTQLSGHDAASDHYDVATGLSVKCLGEAVVKGKKALHFSVTADRTAAITTSSASLRHRLSLQTSDGKVSASPLYLDVEELPFLFEWVNGRPDHVGQKGVLRCVDSYTGQTSTEGVFHLKSGYSSLSPFTDNGDGTITVSLTGPFAPTDDAITITDNVGDRVCKIPLEARLPYFECTDLWTTYVDASSTVKFTYYASKEDGTKSNAVLKVTDSSDPSYTGNGLQLDKALVESVIGPSGSSKNKKLGFEYHLMKDGTYSVSSYIATYDGVSPSGKSFKVDDAYIGMAGPGSTRTPHATAFTAWNPWKNIGGIIAGGLMNDYTLYREPEWLNDGIGWAANPRKMPKEERVNTMNVQSIVVASEKNLIADARFNSEELFGQKAFKGTPTKVSPDFEPSSYWLKLTVNSQSLNDAKKSQLLSYLYGRGYPFNDVEEMMSYLAQNNYELIIGDHFGSLSIAWAAAASGVNTSTGDWGNGCRFTTGSNSSRNRWTLTYSMKDITRDDITTHGAGRIRIQAIVRNPHNGSYLERTVGEAYMRLHIYAWPAMIDLDNENYDGDPGRFSMALYAPMENYTSVLDELLGNRNHMGRFIAYGFDSIYLDMSSFPAQLTLYGGETYISTTEYSDAPVSWSLPEDLAYLGQPANGSLDERKRQFREIIKCGIDYPFYFKYQPELDILNPGCFYRASDYTLYYDPTGTSFEYSYDKEGFKKEKNGKLFVIHLGGGEEYGFAKDVYFPAFF